MNAEQKMLLEKSVQRLANGETTPRHEARYCRETARVDLADLISYVPAHDEFTKPFSQRDAEHAAVVLIAANWDRAPVEGPERFHGW